MIEARKTLRRILPLIALAAGLALPAPAAVLPVEKLLPEDTLFFVCIPDFARARTIYASSPQARLWQDAAMKAFREKLTAKISEEYFAPLERDLGVRLEDYASLPQGQVTFALVPPGAPEKPGSDSAFLLLIDTRDKSPILQTNLADLRKKWLAAGKPLRTDRIRNVEFSVVLATTNDLPKTLTQPASPRPPGLPEPIESPDAKNAAKPELYLGQAESLLIIGNSARAIEKILAAMAGAPIKPLGELPAYAASQNTLFRDAPLFAWANARPFIDQIKHRDDDVQEIEADTNPLSFKWAKVVGAWALTG